MERLEWRQRIWMLVAVAAVVGGLMAATSWNRERDFKPLYKGLAAEDAGQVTARLKERNIEYRLAEDGGTVLVPSSAVDDMRVELASAGLPKSGRLGYELFDKMNLGTTDFAEQVNYHRAIEGELERSALSIAEVERARVHVTFAKHSVFEELREGAKASVMVKLKPGRKLSPSNVVAIQHLAASAVEGLEPPKVAVLDMSGRLLSRVSSSASEGDAEQAETLLAYRRRVEAELLQKVNTTLEPLLGGEKFKASVSVDVDLSSGEQSEETFDPTKSVMVSQSRSEDSSTPQQQAGVPGTASNLPRPTSRPAGAGNAVNRRSENITFQSSRVVRKTKTPQGVTKRLSLAVLVDQTARWEGTGAKARRVLEAPPPAQLKSIHDLLMAAVGASAERGDQVIVESLPFDATLHGPAPEPSAPARPGAPGGLDLSFLPKPLQDPKILAAVCAGLLLLLLGMMALVWKMLRRKGKTVDAARAPAVESGDGAEREAGELASQPAKAIEAVSDATVRASQHRIEGALDGPRTVEEFMAEGADERQRAQSAEIARMKLSAMAPHKNEILARHISEEAAKNPMVTAQVVRSWLQEG